MAHTTTWKPEYTVYKRNDSGAYGVRFSLKGKQYRLGLGKVSEQEANDLAHSKFIETKTLVERNLLSQDAGFETIALDYVETQFKLAEKYPKRLEHARHAKFTVKRYFIGFFENRPITEICHPDLLDYLNWRKVYWTEGEGKDTKFVRHKRGTSEFNLKVQHKEAEVPLGSGPIDFR